MAIFNIEEMYSNAQAIVATIGSTNVYDHGSPGTWVHSTIAIVDDKGNSCIPLAIQVIEAFDALTSLTIALQTDDNAAMNSATTIYSETILLADLVVGKKTAVRYVPFNTTEQYSHLLYTVNGSAPTVGKITAGIATCLESPFGNR